MMQAVPLLDLKPAYQELKPQLDKVMSQVVEGGWYIGGEIVEQFEQQFARYCGVASCVGVGNGLDALTLILRANNIGPGDEVIVPAHTFIATWQAVSNCGAVPVAVDVLANGNINPQAVESAITDKTVALIAVHLYGQIADMSVLKMITAKHSLLLFEDAAQAHGASQKGQRTGSLSDAAAFSFYPGKNLGAMGDGGAVVSNDKTLIAKIRQIANYGSTIKYQHDVVGCNSRLDTLQAAVLSVKLNVLDEWNKRRQKLADYYVSELSGNHAVKPVNSCLDDSNVWHQFVVVSEQRDSLMKFLQNSGVQSQIHYPFSPAQSKVYQSDYQISFFPVTEFLTEHILSLPMGPHLGSDQAEYVIDVIQQFNEHML